MGQTGEFTPNPVTKTVISRETPPSSVDVSRFLAPSGMDTGFSEAGDVCRFG